MSQPLQEQNIEKRIQEYISERYFTPSDTLQLLCSGIDEHNFFDKFKTKNPGLTFLTIEDLNGLSHEYYLTNGSLSLSLDKTFEFINVKLKDYYNSIFNIYICFRFSIIDFIINGTFFQVDYMIETEFTRAIDMYIIFFI